VESFVDRPTQEFPLGGATRDFNGDGKLDFVNV
jgi:hypothetical protein